MLLATLLLSALLAGDESLSSSLAAPTPAERAIALARASIAADEKAFQHHNALAWALARRARETADPDFYGEAEQALARSLELAPDNFEARKAAVWLQLGRHEFSKAHAGALELNRKAPDDVLVYGLLVDACVALGLHDEAEEAAQWMLDLRSGSIPALTRAAHLRELFGDADGAIELLRSAYHAVRPSEVEDRAWILVQIGRVHRSCGRLQAAESALGEALALFPGYHYALFEMAQVIAASDRPDRFQQAAELLRLRHESAPHPENLFDLAFALVRAGQREEALPLLKEFERSASEEVERCDNANLALIELYLSEELAFAREEEGAKERALELAEMEFARRADVPTRAAYAWALHANGRLKEAREQIETVLSVGVRDAVTFHRAGLIALAQGDTAAGETYLREAISLEPSSCAGEAASLALQRMDRD